MSHEELIADAKRLATLLEHEPTTRKLVETSRQVLVDALELLDAVDDALEILDGASVVAEENARMGTPLPAEQLAALHPVKACAERLRAASAAMRGKPAK
jgi:hypothetical protein